MSWRRVKYAAAALAGAIITGVLVWVLGEPNTLGQGAAIAVWAALVWLFIDLLISHVFAHMRGDDE